jgi:hypothetical protein
VTIASSNSCCDSLPRVLSLNFITTILCFLATTREKSEVQSWLDVEESSEEFVASFPENEIVTVDAKPRRHSWLKRFFDRLAGITMPEMSPMLATAMICGVAAVVSSSCRSVLPR